MRATITGCKRVFRLLAVGLLTVTNIGSSAMAVESIADERIFVTAPEPNLLARHLYPAVYRSLNQGGRSADAVAGMLIQFQFDSTAVIPESLPFLDAVGEMLRLPRIRQHDIVIEGHTDSSGDEHYNQQLSEQRAEAIKTYLVDAFGIDAKRIHSLGSGERKPLDSKDSLNPINRRVSFKAGST